MSTINAILSFFFYHLFSCFGSESELLCWNSTVCVSRAANGEISLQEVIRFSHHATRTFANHCFHFLTDKPGITSLSLLLCVHFFLLALTSGPWDVLSISWWLVYHRSELGKYNGSVFVATQLIVNSSCLYNGQSGVLW